MSETAITPEMTVEQVMRQWPATIAVFLRHRMHCVGCAVGPFHSLAEASGEYRLTASAFVAALQAAAAAGGAPDGLMPGAEGGAGQPPCDRAELCGTSRERGRTETAPERPSPGAALAPTGGAA